MFKIGIIGSENSHAAAFSEIFNLSGTYDDVRVTAIWGEDMEASRKIAEKCQVEIVRPMDMLREVDAVMVTSRNGALHWGYVRPFIEAGKPAFVDKPLANDYAEAKSIIDMAAEKRVPLVGGSSLKLIADTLALKEAADEAKAKGELLGGNVYAPVSLDNPYGGFYFYSSHLIEIALTIFGYDPVAVNAVKTKAGIAAVLEYAGYAVTLNYTESAYKYGGVVLAKGGVSGREINMGDAYAREVESFVKMLRTGESD
ncbi:MAG: Gfo/Idh/MocA family oxidoreductase, partial [Clostridiales bacterium]|nr:Gfo/Idh/MocA family oxidoreductase [Clostridiales bacterium]